jgi:hypothetical protein
MKKLKSFLMNRPPILYDHWTEDVRVTPAELSARFAENVRPKRTYREHFAALFKREANPKSFEGVVLQDSFKIYRLIYYRNSFLPIIIGKLEPVPGGTRITITMRLHPFVAVFMAFWIACVGSSAFAMRHAVKQRGATSFAVAVPAGMILFAAVLSISCFDIERRKARKLLFAIVHPDATNR